MDKFLKIFTGLMTFIWLIGYGVCVDWWISNRFPSIGVIIVATGILCLLLFITALVLLIGWALYHKFGESE